jgi:outer membrane protein assembly factor BamD
MLTSNKIKSMLSLAILIVLLPNCGKQEKKTEDMSFDELKQKTLSALERQKNDMAIDCLEKLIAEHPDHQNISEYKLLLADQYFNAGNLPSAYQMYEHFTEFYPADEKAEYAYYRSILAKFYQTLKVDCDQSYTGDTIKLCDTYIDHPQYLNYQNDIKDIRNTCERKLIDKEVYVYNYYLKQGKFQAAQNRLDYLRANYAFNNPTLEARLLFLEAKLAQKQKQDETLKQKIETLAENYPDSHFTKMAERLNSKVTFVF